MARRGFGRVRAGSGGCGVVFSDLFFWVERGGGGVGFEGFEGLRG